jgi:predicted nuclease with TOPRIM domain
MSEYLNELYKNKDITDSSKSLYINKLLALNNKKPIKNLNYLLDIEDIKSKIAKFKNNTQRSYIVSVCSILKCYLNSNSKVNHKFKKTYDEYIKLLNNYNELLQDATAITDTEKTNWITVDTVKDIHNKLKNKVSKMKLPYDLNDKLISLDFISSVNLVGI